MREEMVASQKMDCASEGDCDSEEGEEDCEPEGGAEGCDSEEGCDSAEDSDSVEDCDPGEDIAIRKRIAMMRTRQTVTAQTTSREAARFATQEVGVAGDRLPRGVLSRQRCPRKGEPAVREVCL